MVTAAVEAYPQETLGVLIGLRTAAKILIQYAVAYQTAKRARHKVEAHLKRSQRTNHFLQEVTHLEVVGDFHSHPEVSVDKISSAMLSKTDKDSIVVKHLGMVVAIDKDAKKREWKHLPKGSLKGCVFPYSLKITSWFKMKGDKIEIAKIHCPFALGLGR